MKVNSLLHFKMASILQQQSTFLIRRSEKLYSPVSSLLFSRGIKNNQLYKKKRKRKPKFRDGKEITANHIYWDRYYSDNPTILLERQNINLKNSTGIEGNSPLSAKGVYKTLTTGDKRLFFIFIT